MVFSVLKGRELSRRSFFAGTGAAIALLSASGGACALTLAGTSWSDAGRDYGIDPLMLYAVALQESHRVYGDAVKPHPFTLSTPSRTRRPETYGEAARILGGMTAGELAKLDVGLMQIHLADHAKKAPRVVDFLDPAVNVRVGASILREALNRAPGDLELGIGRYNCWGDELTARKYGRRVLAIYFNLRTL
jgi:hypothetical protein